MIDVNNDGEANPEDYADPSELSGSEFLLSIAGMFSSEETDISENIEQLVAEILRKKYEHILRHNTHD